MPTGYQIVEQDAPHFLTFQVVGWIDVFTRQVYKDLIVENLNYCINNKGLEVFAYVIMTNHIHVIVRSKEGNLSSVVRDFKSYTSKEIIKIINSEIESRRDWMLKLFSEFALNNVRNSKYQLWTQENHAEQLWSDKFTEQKIDYIHMNPVKAGWVLNPVDYLYSSARNYAGIESLVDVTILR